MCDLCSLVAQHQHYFARANRSGITRILKTKQIQVHVRQTRTMHDLKSKIKYSASSMEYQDLINSLLYSLHLGREVALFCETLS